VSDERIDWDAYSTEELGKQLDAALERIAVMEEDVRLAAGELMVDMEDAPPGSLVARLLIANRLMSRERDKAVCDETPVGCHGCTHVLCQDDCEMCASD